MRILPGGDGAPCLWMTQRFGAAIRAATLNPVIPNRAEDPVRNLLSARVQLLNNPEAHVTGKRAARSRHHNLAGRSAARDDRLK